MINKKAISDLVAIFGLLSLAVLGVIGYYSWIADVASDSQARLDEERYSENLDIGEINDGYIVVRSNRDGVIEKMMFGDSICYENLNLYEGVNNINVSSCIDEIDLSIFEVLIITSKSIESKTISKESSLQSVKKPESKFISVWNTSKEGISGNSSIYLPLFEGGEYNFIVKGSTLNDSPVHITNYEDNLLNFSHEGVHEINITGDILGWSFVNSSEYVYFGEPEESLDSLKLIEIKRWGPLNLGNAEGYFYNAQNMRISARDGLNISGTTNFDFMFGSTFLFDYDISYWNVSEVTSMNYMFSGAKSFNQDISDWDVSNVENMVATFDSAKSFNQDISDWDVSSIDSMFMMFYNASDFNQDISEWNVSEVTSMNSMFQYASSFNQNISGWNVSSVTDMNHMFANASSFNENLSSWEVDNVTDCLNFNFSTPQWIKPIPDFQNCDIESSS